MYYKRLSLLKFMLQLKILRRMTPADVELYKVTFMLLLKITKQNINLTLNPNEWDLCSNSKTVIGFGRPSQVPRVRFYCSCERKRTIMGIIILSSNTEYAVSSLINVIVATLPSRVKGMKKKPWKYWYVNNIIAYINIKITGIVQTCSVAYWKIQLSIEMQTCSRFVFSCL